MSSPLKGKKVAFLATDGFEQIEFTKPWDEIQKAGADTELVSLKSGNIQGFEHFEPQDEFPVDATVGEAKASEYDGLVIPGGVHNPDALRLDPKAVQFVKDFLDAGKPVAAICHGPWVLVEAGAVKGRTVTSWPSLKTDITNAGGTWVDKEVVTDNGLTTSRKPADLSAFCRKVIEELAEGSHSARAA